MILLRKNKIAFWVLAISAVITAGAITVGTLFPTYAHEDDRPIIIIDAGHAGFS